MSRSSFATSQRCCSCCAYAMIVSSFKLMCRSPSFGARSVLDGLLLDGRRDRMPRGILFESHRLAHPLHDRPNAPFEAS